MGSGFGTIALTPMRPENTNQTKNVNPQRPQRTWSDLGRPVRPHAMPNRSQPMRPVQPSIQQQPQQWQPNPSVQPQPQYQPQPQTQPQPIPVSQPGQQPVQRPVQPSPPPITNQAS